MKSRSLERQILVVTLVPILLAALLLEGHFIYTRFADLDGALLERAQLLVRQLASSSEYAVFSGNKTLLQKEVDATMAQQDVASVTVLNEASAVLVGRSRSGPGVPAWVSPAARLYQDDGRLVLYQPIVATQVDLDEPGQESVAAPAPLGAVIVEISKQRLNGQKGRILLFNFLATVLVLALTLAAAIWASRRIAGPILAMSQAIRRIGQGDLDTRLPLRSDVSELKELAAGINRMTQQLSQRRTDLQSRIEEVTKELRQKKEEAEIASRDKSRFLAAASHDLRQPMHALGLFVGQLRGKVETPEQVRIAKQIEESSEAMGNLLSSLLDISKLDAGIVTPQVHPFTLAPLLNRMAQDYAAVAEGKGIALRVRSSGGAIVESDPILLERILLNLLSNALNHTPPQGRVLVGCRRRGKHLRIEVRDSGVGISPADQQNIFREFFQVENAARDRGRGLGLGLAIVERLSHLLGHPVLLRSESGRGSTFAVEVPVLETESVARLVVLPDTGVAEHESAYEMKGGPLSGASVLLVDDDALVRASTEGMLASWGCLVRAVASKREAIAQCRNGDVDLLICDYRLPDGTGLEIIAEAGVQCARRIPAILISGDTAPEILQQVAAGGCHLLHKPVRPAKLRSLMLFLLGNAGETTPPGG